MEKEGEEGRSMGLGPWSEVEPDSDSNSAPVGFCPMEQPARPLLFPPDWRDPFKAWLHSGEEIVGVLDSKDPEDGAPSQSLLGGLVAAISPRMACVVTNRRVLVGGAVSFASIPLERIVLEGGKAIDPFDIRSWSDFPKAAAGSEEPAWFPTAGRSDQTGTFRSMVDRARRMGAADGPSDSGRPNPTSKAVPRRLSEALGFGEVVLSPSRETPYAGPGLIAMLLVSPPAIMASFALPGGWSLLAFPAALVGTALAGWSVNRWFSKNAYGVAGVTDRRLVEVLGRDDVVSIPISAATAFRIQTMVTPNKRVSIFRFHGEGGDGRPRTVVMEVEDGPEPVVEAYMRALEGRRA